MGINVLPVSVTTPAGVNILNEVPQHVTVVIDELIEKDLKVEVFLRGMPSAGYIAGKPKVVPNTVLARGHSKILSKVDAIPVVLDIKNAKEDIDVELPVSIGHEKVDLIPDRVRVVLSIDIGVPYKTFAVEPNVAEELLGYELEIKVEPPVVNVYAPENVLNELEKIYTDLDDLIKNVENKEIIKTVRLKTPSGTLLLEPEEVSVSIKIKKLEKLSEVENKEEAF
ncbi:CdaR family protein [Peptococcaceae bacterium]|nr:CdaR family protein [Peptococcaceae bacterium]